MATRLQCLLSAFLCLALLAKMAELRLRRRRDAQAPMLILALGSFTLAGLVGIPVTRQHVPFLDVPGVPSVIMDTGVSLSLALLNVYLWTPLGGDRAVPWWRERLFLSAWAVSVLIAGLMAATPPRLRTNPLQNEYTGDWRIVGIYVLGNLFFLHCSTASAIACVRITRIVRGHVTIGVAVGAIGMVAYAVTCVNRLVLVLTQLIAGNGWFAWYSVLNFVFTDAAVLASVLGLHFTALWRVVAACRQWYADLRAFRLLGPVWRRLTAMYPDVVLHREHGVRGLWDRLDVSYRKYRREIECQDALLLLTGGCPSAERRTAARHAGLDDEQVRLLRSLSSMSRTTV